jgi:DNA repair protein RecN (Recombination protein N)
MLRRLIIENYALIDALEINFSGSFDVITGETGAGKSILLGALGLILGNRADIQSLKNSNKKCVVEGFFEPGIDELQSFFIDNDLDYSPEIILRREILPGGKSRAFINDTPVQLISLKELGSRLVDVHSQHQTLLLNESGFQLDVIDSYCGNAPLLKDYLMTFKAWKGIRKNLQDLYSEEKRSGAEREFLEFVFSELESAKLIPGEQTELEQELAILTHAEEIKSRLYSIHDVMNDQENALLSSLASVSAQMSQLGKYHSGVGNLGLRIESAYQELKDIASEIHQISEEVVYDSERIVYINERLDILYRLQQKHRVHTVEELLDLMKQTSDSLYNLGSLQSDIETAEKDLIRIEADLMSKSAILHDKRKSSLALFSTELIALLKDLGMPDASVQLHLEPLNEPDEKGNDRMLMLFSANKGQEPKPISKVASGGELSRLMLAVKSMTVKNKLIPSLILDEIDAGVSGDIADKAGELMKQMARGMQLIAITHLPQIAGKGKEHFLVYKETGKDETRSAIRKLSEKERIDEIAKMLSGAKISDAAMEAAKHLMG